VVLIIIAVLVVFNTIRLSIYNSSEEIKIQRLVGASNLSIRGPFLVQGVISGLIATFICFLFFALLSWSLNSSTESFFYGFSLFNMFISNFWVLLFLQFITGISLGTLSSSIAIRKYLKT
jgi:cell division transport system permease protein